MESHATQEMDMDTYPMGQNTEEFWLLVAYCERRKRQLSGLTPLGHKFSCQGPALPKHMPQAEYQGGRKLKTNVVTDAKKVNVSHIFSSQVDVLCPLEKKKTYEYEFLKLTDQKGSLSGVADQLTQIADTVEVGPSTDIAPVIKHPQSGNIEADGTEDNDEVIRKIVELLKVSGDKLNEEIKRNPTLQKHLQTSFTYGLFEKVTTGLLQGIGCGGPAARPEDPASGERNQREQIALACEVTSRLSALGLHPMNQVLGFGSCYLQRHHTAWVKKHGGWNKAFDSEDTD